MDAPAFPARWQVSEPELIAETFSSRIWKVRREDGSTAIVKALKPFDDVADELRGEHFLAWRRGEGAVRLLGRDGHSMLLEYGGDTLLSQVLDEQGDNAATAIAADMMAKLFSPSDHPYPPNFSRSGSGSPVFSRKPQPIASSAMTASMSRPAPSRTGCWPIRMTSGRCMAICITKTSCGDRAAGW